MSVAGYRSIAGDRTGSAAMNDREINDREIPPTEPEQPDPQLNLSSGRASTLQITLATLGSILILALMVYGLNRPMNEPSQTAAAPPVQETTAAGPPAQETTGAAPQNQKAQPQPNPPAQQPQPEPAKPAQPDDSHR
jgi:hypothetical protein